MRTGSLAFIGLVRSPEYRLESPASGRVYFWLIAPPLLIDEHARTGAGAISRAWRVLCVEIEVWAIVFRRCEPSGKPVSLADQSALAFFAMSG
ncbi:hypothetical protein GCM10007420_22240 [Glycocaulis albus]|uniref:Uncharacterized protein n=1 Tax=Glycocaulis albus TaxID=1382801 RepID=A0ABQ1XWJ2_9PROT|nr:hypothetical protein GCM10007420_22240 [Glycocaulis albus]